MRREYRYSESIYATESGSVYKLHGPLDREYYLENMQSFVTLVPYTVAFCTEYLHLAQCLLY